MSKQVILVVIAAAILSATVAAQESIEGGSTGIEIAKGVHLLSGLSCNVMAVTGSSGVLIIDNGSANDSERLEKSVADLSAGQVQLVINTHFHFDHIGGNEALVNKGAFIIAHQNGRPRMQAEWRFPEVLGFGMRPVPPYPEGALPKVLISDELTMHFGGHTIEILHLPSAHSDSDLVVYLRDANVLHTGDLYLSNGFTLTDSYHGGTIDGIIAAIGELIGLIDDNTKVVPGHGPLSNRKELQIFRQMIKSGRGRIAALIAEGKTLDEVIAAKPTAGLYADGKSWINETSFVRLAYADLAGLNIPTTKNGANLVN